MLPERDIWQAAKIMIDRFGNDAIIDSAKRADELADEGDYEGSAVWQRIMRAADELLSTESDRRKDELRPSPQTRPPVY